MKHSKRIVCFLLMVTCVLLSACSSPVHTGTTHPNESMVDNIFTTPTTEETQSIGIGDTIPQQVGYSGDISHGFTDKTLVNENGLYHNYDGGELHINYGISVTGNLGDAGIGILLILDGQPQPYKTAENDEYAYLHTFYPGEQKKLTVELIFTPVTGESGDTLELSAFHVLGPDYYPNDRVIGMMQTNGSVWSSTQLVFQATPPTEEMVSTVERIVTKTMEYVDLTSDDMKGWSSEALQTDYSFSFETNHESSASNIYGISKNQDLTVYVEVFGATSVKWSLIVYVDHQPVSVLSENQLDFSTKNGQKTAIEMTLDMDDFNGESIIYAVLYVRNWRAPTVLNSTNCTTEITDTYYLTDTKDLVDMDLKYGRTSGQ